MAHIYCVMGKSASGKDTIYQRLIESEELNLNKIVPYTTRPRREGEVCGESYVFCDEAEVDRLEREGRIVELREYNTVFGIWKYFTVDNGDIDYKNKDYIYSPGSGDAGRKAVISMLLSHEVGVLSTALNKISNLGASVLTISQSMPIRDIASVVMTLDVAQVEASVEIVTETLSAIPGVENVYLLAIE